MIIDAGYSKPIASISVAEKDELMQAGKMHYVLLHNKAEIDQLKLGLAVLGVGEALNKSSELLRPLFCDMSVPLTAG